MPQSALASPTIEQADNDGAGPELHTGNLTQASVRMGDWPLIALNQYVWLRLRGIKADGSAYLREIWSAPTAFTTPDWIADRFFTAPLPADELNALQDGSGLALAFKAALGQSTVESEAVEFPVRTYTIKAFEDVRPEITRVEDSKGEEILPGATTVDTSIKLKGKGAKGQKVLIKDGNIEIGIADVDPQSGDWEFPVTGLSANTHSFTATARYGNEEVSLPRIVVVTAPTAPTITRVENSKGEEILPGATTVDTSIKLKGKGAKGQKVLIKDGNIEIGIADIDPQSGDWEFPVTGLSADTHSFTATAQYGSGAVSGPRVVVVTAPTAPTITRVENSKGEEILPGATTVDTSIKLKGKGAKGQKVLIKDGNIEIGIADIDPQSGDWEFPVTGLSADTHSFTATAKYGSGQVSNPPRVVVVISELILDTSTVTLNGRIISQQGVVPQLTRWGGYIPPNTRVERIATGGRPPYTYTSSAPQIASVLGGSVESEGNGSATITVTDSSSPPQRKSFIVNASNVIRLIQSPQPILGPDSIQWAASIGGTPIAPGYASAVDVDLFLSMFSMGFHISYHVCAPCTTSFPQPGTMQVLGDNALRAFLDCWPNAQPQNKFALCLKVV
jgi:hypothetical protein